MRARSLTDCALCVSGNGRPPLSRAAHCWMRTEGPGFAPAIRVVPQKFRFCLLKNKRQEFFFAPKVLSGGQTDRVLARRAVCTSDNQASMSKQGESPDYECRRRLREHAVRSNLLSHTVRSDLLSRTVRSNLLSHTLPTPPSIP